MFHIGFLEIRIVDVIDIVIVAAILYRLYVAMRGTIAAQIFFGLLFILAISIVSEVLNFVLLSWFLRTLRDIWLIALIILFQPELRRILLMIGRQGFTGVMKQYDIADVVDAILLSVRELKEKKFGALIVLTRATKITFSIDRGVPIGADVSKELLMTIFNPKSPLHDGAVIISGDRIESAGVILPFSSSLQIPDERLGTRHRAGLGISEQADVVAIIVSEETGYISYASEGVLHYNESIDDIRRELIETLKSDNSAESSVWKRILSFFIPRKQSFKRT